MNLLPVDVSFCRMEYEVDCQQTRPVVNSMLNKTPDVSGSEIKASVICTKCSFSNPVEFCQTGADTQESTPAPV